MGIRNHNALAHAFAALEETDRQQDERMSELLRILDSLRCAVDTSAGRRTAYAPPFSDAVDRVVCRGVSCSRLGIACVTDLDPLSSSRPLMPAGWWCRRGQ